MRRLLRRARRRLLPPGPGRHRLVGRRVVCSCHGRDLTEMRDADVLALHPIVTPGAFVAAREWLPDGGSVRDAAP